ncbi:unnamed protein product, partial [Symbiodinium necroappetens]
VAGLQKSLADRQGLWEKYEQDLRASYRKEHARFSRDVQRLREDLAKAVEAQETVQRELVAVAWRGPRQEAPAPCAADEDFLAAWRAEPTANDAQEVIRRALQANAGRPRMDAAHPAGGVDMSDLGPWSRRSEVEMRGAPPLSVGPPTAAWEPLGAAATHVPEHGLPRDPYMPSPGARVATPVTSPSQHYKATDGTRISVKTKPAVSAPPTGGVTLGSKLEARRTALALFGVMPPAQALHSSQDSLGGDHATSSNSGGPFLTDAEIRSRLGAFSLVDDDKETGGEGT